LNGIDTSGGLRERAIECVFSTFKNLWRLDMSRIIREFKTANFTVRVEALIEYLPDFSFDESGEIAEAVERGEMEVFCAKASVHYRGVEIAGDFLGNCIYRDIADFEDHRECAAETRRSRAAGSTAIVGSYFADMVHTAIKDAREFLLSVPEVRP
jgi:hypothetical protein